MHVYASAAPSQSPMYCHPTLPRYCRYDLESGEPSVFAKELNKGECSRGREGGGGGNRGRGSNGRERNYTEGSGRRWEGPGAGTRSGAEER